MHNYTYQMLLEAAAELVLVYTQPAAKRDQNGRYAEDWRKITISLRGCEFMNTNDGTKTTRQRARCLTDEALKMLKDAILEKYCAGNNGGVTNLISFSQIPLTVLVVIMSGDRTNLDVKTVEKILDRAGNDLSKLKGVFKNLGLTWKAHYSVLLPNRVPNNLPPPREIIGRTNEINQVVSFLNKHRIVTLTGAGGIGKTHLALSTANVLSMDSRLFPDGIWLVNLASVNSDQANKVTHPIHQLIAEALGIRLNKNTRECLIQWLSNKNLLLILDNCEHLLDECKTLVESFIRPCPNVKVIATSLRLLNIQGEQLYNVPPLGQPISPEAILASTSGQYFIDQARLKSPDFTVTEANANDLYNLLALLGGNPLWIQLAAAHVRHMPVSQLLVNINTALAGGSSTEQRQISLDELMKWVLGCLTQPQIVLLYALAEFRGGWTIQAAVAACSDLKIGTGVNEQSMSEQTSVVEMLTSLVDWNLVVRPSAAQRYSMLEPIRLYAHGKLDEASRNQLQQSLISYFVTWTRETVAKLESRQPELLQLIGAEIYNLTACLDWATIQCPKAALQLACSLTPFWDISCYWAEAYNRLSNLLTLNQEADKVLLATAYLSAGIFAKQLGKFDEAKAMMLTSEKLLGEYVAENPPGNDISLQRKYGSFLSKIYNNLAIVAQESGNFTQEIEMLGKSIDIKRRQNLTTELAISLANRGYTYYINNELDNAKADLLEAISVLKPLGDSVAYANALNNLGGVLRLQNQSPDRVFDNLKSSLLIRERLNDRRGIIYSLYEFAHLLRVIGGQEQSVQLIAQVDKLNNELNYSFPHQEECRKEELIALLKQNLSIEEYTSVLTKGCEMTVEQAVHIAYEAASQYRVRHQNT